MFLSELSPLFQELIHKPVAFMGGFISGLLHLNLSDEPVSKWLEQQTRAAARCTSASKSANNGQGSVPQSITID